MAELFGDREALHVEFDWLIQRVQTIGYVQGHEMSFCTISGRAITVELTATHLTDDNGQAVGTSVILRDVTERKHRDEEIRQLNAGLNEQVAERTRELAEKVEQLARANAELRKLDQMRTEFVSVVSHQIRAPLTNMRGAMERMEGDCPVINATCARMFTILDQQAARLDRLVKDVLNAARIEAGQLVLESEPLSVMPVVQQVVEQIRARTDYRPINVMANRGCPWCLLTGIASLRCWQICSITPTNTRHPEKKLTLMSALTRSRSSCRCEIEDADFPRTISIMFLTSFIVPTAAMLKQLMAMGLVFTFAASLCRRRAGVSGLKMPLKGVPSFRLPCP